eukprot:1161067-Pelagomonas_calceolata.AAC.7
MHRGRNNDAITPPTCQTKAWLMSEHRNTGAAEEPTRWPGTYKYGNGYMESVKCACVRVYVTPAEACGHKGPQFRLSELSPQNLC